MKDNNSIIKVGFCVSYDWEMLKNSIPLIYKEADIICLGLDQNRRSWKGNKYKFDEAAFKALVKELDVDNKIDIYEDDFALSNLNSRENCNRQRMKIADRMGKGGWHIQIDSDEYFFDFKGFTKYLTKIHKNPTGNEKGFNVNVNLIPLIKKTEQGYLFVDFKEALPEAAPFATNRPNYERARHNGYFCNISPFYVIHETWARSDEDLLYKINNWGHSAEELEEKQTRISYYNLWQSLDEYNYQYIQDFHPAKANEWPSLSYCKGNNIKDVFNNIKKPKFPIGDITLKLYNTKVSGKLRQILGDPYKK